MIVKNVVECENGGSIVEIYLNKEETESLVFYAIKDILRKKMDEDKVVDCFIDNNSEDLENKEPEIFVE